MSASHAAAQLTRIEKDVLQAWQQTRSAWRDRNAEQFEAEMIDPLVQRLRATQHAVGILHGILERMRRECG